jgi:predicted ATPase
LRLENFKSHAETGLVPLRPLTLIIGRNNAGKSALLHSLLLLKQTYEDRDRSERLITSGDRVDLGSFRDILRKSARTKQLAIDVAFSQSMVEATDDPDDKQLFPPLPDSLSLRFGFNASKNDIDVLRSAWLNGSKVTVALDRVRGEYELSGPAAQVRRHLKAGLVHYLPRLDVGDRPPKSESLRDRVIAYWSWSQACEHIWTHITDALQHVAPVRPPLPRYSAKGQTGASGPWAAGENLLRELASSKKVGAQRIPLIESLTEWLDERLNVIRGLRIEYAGNQSDVFSLLADSAAGLEGINVADMGSGVWQLLPILSSVLTTRNDGTLLVEQPELHLHPAAQADVAEVFIQNLRARSIKRQFIVETHSEHIVLRIRTAIAGGRLDPDEVQVLVVEPGRGRSTIRVLTPDDRGHFPEWPSAFFEVGFEEALAYAEATQRSNPK